MRYCNYFIKSTLETADVHDIPKSSLLKNSGICQQSIINPYSYISLPQDKQVHLNLLENIDLPGAGLYLGELNSLYNLGPWGVMARTCPIEKLAALVTRLTDLVPMHIEYQYQSHQQYQIYTVSSSASSDLLRVFAIERFLSMVCNIFKTIYGKSFSPIKIHIEYPEPSYTSIYNEKLGCPVLFSKERTQLILPTTNPSIINKHQDCRIFKAAEQIFENIIEEKSLVSTSSYSDIIKLSLNQNINKKLTLDTISKDVGLSPRSIRRHLEKENITFQNLVDDIKFTHSKNKLVNTDLSIGEIGKQCGFNEKKSFIRAFKRWSGSHPDTIRIERI